MQIEIFVSSVCQELVNPFHVSLQIYKKGKGNKEVNWKGRKKAGRENRKRGKKGGKVNS
jgi:hypothetical protein